MKKIFTSLLCGLMSTATFAQWSPTSMKGEKLREASNVKSYYSLDLNEMRSKLANAQETGKGAKPVEIKLPTLNGKIERFSVYSSPVVVKSLADRYNLGSYVGVGIDDPTAYVRFSVSPNDFQSMILKNGSYEFIEPQNSSKSVYGVHPKTNKADSDRAFLCSTSETPLTKQQMDKMYAAGQTFTNNPLDFSKASDKKYRTMRLAMSVTGEYTTYFGGVAGALTAINATMTRSNFVFEKDFGLHLILQDFPALIYTNAATDPYSPASSGAQGAWNLELQKTLTSVIGNDAYDIGHLFGASGGGGNAGCIGCVCVNPASPTSKAKGSGYTSPADGKPFGDNFDIDYVAHEIGHQLGANHTFSHSLEGTGQNVEPGSGSTIMGYAGITGGSDVQPHSDAYFHINSIIQVQNNLISKTCDVETAVTNNPPVITAMQDVTIPKGTAFVLTAQATDTENNPLNYTWEQVDNATTPITKANLGSSTNGASFRSVMGTANPTRFFPKFETVMAGTLSNTNGWEAVSSVARTTNFRVTVRDNNPDVKQQQTQTALQKVVVHANGPFKITSNKVFNNSPQPLTWDVVGTNAAPFNVENVKIDYTSDNGATWVVLAASTPNDGSEVFDFSSLATNTVLKVRISAVGNIFYAVAPVTVSVAVACTGAAPANLTANSITDNSAELSWQQLAGATYIVRYKKVADATWTVVNSNSSSLTITGLTDSTPYEYQVLAICASVTSPYSTSFNFTTASLAYCAASSTTAAALYINNVTVANIANASSGSVYSNFTTNPALKVNLVKGTNYPMTIKANTTAANFAMVFIDYNRNGTFEDGERVLNFPVTNASTFTGSFTVPASAMIGETLRMRVIFGYAGASNIGLSAPTAWVCGTNFNDGEVEDYNVVVSNDLASNEINAKNAVQIYPNPAIDVLNVTKVSDKATYTIYNMAGQAVSKGKVTDNKVQVSRLEKGVYMIAVDHDGQVSQLKFIKQ